MLIELDDQDCSKSSRFPLSCARDPLLVQATAQTGMNQPACDLINGPSNRLSGNPVLFHEVAELRSSINPHQSTSL